MTAKIRVGISTCLLGERVRYDGQHKHDRFLTETLGQYLEYVPVCPEVECGLPVPREAMRLVGNPGAPRLMTQRTGRDLTDQMLSWAATRVRELEKENLCGFIFKSKSPSSGMERVKVYNGKGGLSGRGPGMFARAFMQHFPLLPVEDDGRLHDPDLRENFIERLFTLDRYRRAVGEKPDIKALMDFHARNKLLLMSHSQSLCRDMGKQLAQTGRQDVQAVVQAYEASMLKALGLMSTPRKHANVLQHMLGYFKKDLTHDEKEEMLELIDHMRNGDIPLVVPVTLMCHYARKYKVTYLRDQTYLNPHPLELKLRNHA